MEDLKKFKLPDLPGVYFFRESPKKILYIGKATSLRDRVRSYLGNDILKTRGLKIANMVSLAKSITFLKTDSVLEALLLEAELIKKHSPLYNTKEKDDKSFNLIVLTDEAYPRVLLVRHKNLDESHNFVLARQKIIGQAKEVFGPYPSGSAVKEALRLIRQIFPFRDKCAPLSGRPCFQAQIGLCPGVCAGTITSAEYKKSLKGLTLFLRGQKKSVLNLLRKQMKEASQKLLFEEASRLKKTIFAITHIRDIGLLKRESLAELDGQRSSFRIEAYDVAHLAGTGRVGAMVVLLDGQPRNGEYRLFRLKKDKNDDLAGLAEILERRLNHPEWGRPDLLVVDGGENQKKTAERVLKERNLTTPVVAVLKDERHRPKEVLGEKILVDKWRPAILLANAEAHRFSLNYHRRVRKHKAFPKK